MGSQAATVSQPVQVTGATASTQAPVAVKPVTVQDLTPANDRYQRYAAAQLADLAAQVTTIQSDLRRDDIAKAKQDWLAAQLDGNASAPPTTASATWAWRSTACLTATAAASTGI